MIGRTIAWVWDRLWLFPQVVLFFVWGLCEIVRRGPREAMITLRIISEAAKSAADFRKSRETTRG